MIKSKEVIIGKDCFVGCNTLILKGSKIGDGSVVGAGSVVAGIFPSNCVIAGNPAKIIKNYRLFNYEKENCYYRTISTSNTWFI